MSQVCHFLCLLLAGFPRLNVSLNPLHGTAGGAVCAKDTQIRQPWVNVSTVTFVTLIKTDQESV